MVDGQGEGVNSPGIIGSSKLPWAIHFETIVLLVAVMAVLAGCGAQSRVAQLKSLTPSEASNLVKSFEPKCNAPGRVLVRYTSPIVHGEGNESWWCIEPAQAYRIVSRDLHCPPHTNVKIDFTHHLVVCKRR